MTTKLDQLQIQASERRSLQARVTELECEQEKYRKVETNELLISKGRPQNKKITQSSNLDGNDVLLDEIAGLKGELLQKEQQLMTTRALNYQLTIQYDKSVNSICLMEEELSSYRKENNEMKKMLSLQREQERCWQLEEKYTRGQKLSRDSDSLAPMSAEALSESEQSKSPERYSTLKQAETFY